ncbi:hypothetical protein H0G86_008274 [Trichoderma simmonsii]|uniref:Uncharacterized protein n=1 Tax=Trichoderma simmonsii TaxID=1491479 RepID=A0A8G0LF75_9HYPO|nr:hypothetical protein H0G86_008274 [Trichoderma simmonsii]
MAVISFNLFLIAYGSQPGQLWNGLPLRRASTSTVQDLELYDLVRCQWDAGGWRQGLDRGQGPLKAQIPG